MWRYRVVVSEVLQTLILNELYATHLSMAKMKSVACSYVHWPCIDSEFERLSNSRSSCLLDRPSPAKAELHKWCDTNIPWEQLHFDYLGLFEGKMNLVIVDAHSKWPEELETASTAAHLAINNLRALLARFGSPVMVMSDNGPPFNSAEFQRFLVNNGMHRIILSQSVNTVKYIKQNMQKSFQDNVNVSIEIQIK